MGFVFIISNSVRELSKYQLESDTVSDRKPGTMQLAGELRNLYKMRDCVAFRCWCRGECEQTKPVTCPPNPVSSRRHQ